MSQKAERQFNSNLAPNKGSELWKERWSVARTNQDRMFKRFADWYDSLYAQVGRVPSPWRSKVYVPVLAKQTWNLLAKFLTIKPGFIIQVRDQDLDNVTAEEKANKMQKKLEFDYDNDYFEETMRDKLFSPLLDALVTGTGMAKVPWSVCKETKFERLKDAYDTIDLSKHKKTEITHGFNDLIPVNIFGVFVSPAAKNLYDSPWVIIREYKPIAALEAINEAEGKQVYQNLDKLNGQVNYDTYASYDRSRNRLLTNADPTDKTIRMVALYECYEKKSNKIYTYASGGASGKDSEGWTLLREVENPYWHGKYPLVKFHVKKKAYNFWGEGIFEVTYRLQAAYNDIVNHYIDAMNVAFDPMLMAPEDANVDDYVVQPAGLVQYQGTTAPTPFKHIAPQPEQLQTPLELFDQAIEGVTIANYATGIANDRSDKTQGTATGILRLQQAAGDVVTFFRQNFMQSMVQIGKMWMSNNQQFMLRPLTVNVNTPEGKKSIEIKPEDLQGDMDLTIDESSMEPQTQEDKITQFKGWLQDVVMLQNQSMLQNKAVGTPILSVDFTKISEDLSEQYKFMDFSKILVPQQQLEQLHQQQMAQAAQHMQAAQQQAQQQNQPPPQDIKDYLNIKFTDLPEDVQQQLIPMLFPGVQTSGEPTPTEKGLMLKGMSAVTQAAGKGHEMQMSKIGMAHQVAQADTQNAMQQQQMAQQAQQAQQPNNNETEMQSNETGSTSGTSQS